MGTGMKCNTEIEFYSLFCQVDERDKTISLHLCLNMYNFQAIFIFILHIQTDSVLKAIVSIFYWLVFNISLPKIWNSHFNLKKKKDTELYLGMVFGSFELCMEVLLYIKALLNPLCYFATDCTH